MINRPPERLPASGWLTGNVRDLAVLVQRATAPPPRVDALAQRLENGIGWAADRFTKSNPYGSPRGDQVAAILGQSDDSEGQTRRMAMTVVTTALIFQEALADSFFVVRDQFEDVDRHVKHVDECKPDGLMIPSLVTDEWRAILRVNYWPIFWTAISSSRPFARPTERRRSEHPLVDGPESDRGRSDPLPRSDRDRISKADRRPQVPGHFLHETNCSVVARRPCDAGGPAARRSGLGRRRNTRRRSDRRLRMRHRHAPFRCLPTHVVASRVERRAIPGRCTPR